MVQNDEVTSLAQDLKVIQDELRKARQDKRDFEDAMNRIVTFSPDIKQEKQNLDSHIEWLEKMVEYMRRRLKNARKRTKENSDNR